MAEDAYKGRTLKYAHGLQTSADFKCIARLIERAPSCPLLWPVRPFSEEVEPQFVCLVADILRDMGSQHLAIAATSIVITL